MSPLQPRGVARTAWFILLLMVLLASASCAASSASKPATPAVTSSASSISQLATPLPSASSTPELAPTPLPGPVGLAPTNCPVAPPLQTVSGTTVGGGFTPDATLYGASPVWQLGLPKVGAVHLGQNGTDSQQGPKVLWAVGPNYPTTVILRGQNLRTGIPIWFDIYPNTFAGTNDIYTTAAHLDPANPNRSSGVYNIWGIGVLFPSAGCYEVDVSWTGGSWRSIYAVGR